MTSAIIKSLAPAGGRASAVLIWASTAILLLIVFNRFNWKENTQLQWDASGYYLYLPAAVIYHDLDRYAFYPGANAIYHLAPDADYFALHPQRATGRMVNKYPIGVALLEAPFFALSHCCTVGFTRYPPDGFSPLYRLFIFISGVIWTVAGLWMLRGMLRRYFTERVVCLTLALLLFATNLYNYTSFDPGMSHPYSFFLFAAALMRADCWHRDRRARGLVVLGLIAGVILIVRPLNVLFLPLLLVWQPGTRGLIRPFAALVSRPKAVVSAIAGCLFVVTLQCLYWKYASGSWIHYSYEGEGFDFGHPHIMEGLFSYRKGWMLYTPLALFCIAGIGIMIRTSAALGIAIVCYVFTTVFCVFSWHQWYYGGSFGCRVMIESFAVLSVPLALFITWLFTKNMLVRMAGTMLLILCLLLNIWQTYQFSIAMIPTDGNSREWYWRALIKLEKTPEDEAIFQRTLK